MVSFSIRSSNVYDSKTNFDEFILFLAFRYAILIFLRKSFLLLFINPTSFFFNRIVSWIDIIS